MTSLLSKTFSRSLMWKVGPLPKTLVLGRWPWLEAEDELSAEEIHFTSLLKFNAESCA